MQGGDRRGGEFRGRIPVRTFRDRAGDQVEDDVLTLDGVGDREAVGELAGDPGDTSVEHLGLDVAAAEAGDFGPAAARRLHRFSPRKPPPPSTRQRSPAMDGAG